MFTFFLALELDAEALGVCGAGVTLSGNRALSSSRLSNGASGVKGAGTVGSEAGTVD